MTGMSSSSTGFLDGSSSSGGGESLCPQFFDDFEDGVENPVWIQAPNPASLEADGEWTINITAAGEDDFARMMLPLEGGFEGATIRFEIGTPPSEDDVLLILWIQQNAGGAGRVAFNLIQRAGTLELEARVTSESGPPGFVVDSTTWDPKTQRWLQLREAAGTVHFEASSDGLAFEEVFVVEMPIGLDDVSVGFVGHNRTDLERDTEVSIRSFELLCGE